MKSPDAPARRRGDRSPRAEADGRERALRALALMDDGMPIQAAVDAVLDGCSLPLRERRLCTELVYGCARERIRCDVILGRLLRRPDGLPRPMRHCLAIAVHSLLFQERIPEHAAISMAVRQVDRLYGVRLARVANGVLRSLQRLGPAPRDVAWYAEAADAADQRAWRAACRFWSMPPEIADLWRDAYGEEAALALMRRSFQRPWTGVRINARHPQATAVCRALEAATPEAARAAAGAWGMAFAPGALPDAVLGLPLAELRAAGALEFQSAGSQILLQELGLTAWDAPVWDACAGVGGKSRALLEAGVPVRLATDLSRGRLARARTARSPEDGGTPLPVIADAAQPPVRVWDGHILVDAPCSGLGVLARRPDIRFAGRRTREAMRAYPKTQGRMLTALAVRLQPGRELAYLTCTLNPAENEAVVASLTEADTSLELVRSWSTPLSHPWLEGMYGAVVRRRAGP